MQLQGRTRYPSVDHSAVAGCVDRNLSWKLFGESFCDVSQFDWLQLLSLELRRPSSEGCVSATGQIATKGKWKRGCDDAQSQYAANRDWNVSVVVVVFAVVVVVVVVVVVGAVVAIDDMLISFCVTLTV